VAARNEEVRAHLVAVLGRVPNLSVTPLSGAAALLQTGAGDHRLVVMHCECGSSEELALIGELKRDLPELRIIAVCRSENLRAARRVADAGVDGIVLAARVASVLAPTVAAVLAGQAVVPRELRVSLHRPVLSTREKQILAMVVMGFTNSQICEKLFLAESTVKSHLSSAFTKLGVRSRHEAAALILDPHGTLGTGILAITSPPVPAPA
jgi:DNA-binding NarL/FixJ family response regulator